MAAPETSSRPLAFGPADRGLFGILHPSPRANEQPALPGVLICNPFGQEAVRAHRMLRVLAERLARAGHAVLRFDYHGTGDSMGDDLDGDLSGWAADVRTADQELRTRSGATQTIWIGMRLGGSIALRAAQQAPPGLGRIVMWDPVFDGARYLRHLSERHETSLEVAFSLRQVRTAAAQSGDPAQTCQEAIGFAVSPLLREQLVAMNLADHRWPPGPASIVVVSDPDDADGGDLATVCAADPGRVQIAAVRHRTDWTTDEAGDSALVPTQALMQLVQHAGRSI